MENTFNQRSIQPGDRVRIDGGRFEDRTGRVERVVSPDDSFFGNSLSGAIISEPMALIRFDQVYNDGLDATGVPVRRCKSF
jgi:hypothetical protein